MNVKDDTPKLSDGERILKSILDNIFSNPDRPPIPKNWRKSGGVVSVQNSAHKSEAFEWWRTEANTDRTKKDAARMAFARAIKGLQNKGLLVFHDDFLGQANTREHETNTF